MKWSWKVFLAPIPLVGLLAANACLLFNVGALLRGQQPPIIAAEPPRLGLLGESDLWPTAGQSADVTQAADTLPSVDANFSFAPSTNTQVDATTRSESGLVVEGESAEQVVVSESASVPELFDRSEVELPDSESLMLAQPWWSRGFQAGGGQAGGGRAGGGQVDSGVGQGHALDASAQVSGGSASEALPAGTPWQLEQLIWLAIEHSPLVQSVLVEPQIQQARAAATTGVFDPTTFVESIFNDTSDPVGNTLVTGSANRLNEHLWENRSGIRNKNVRGGQTEFSQELLFKDNNSDFFIPADQADTRMVLSYTQPLMRGRGIEYNQASLVVATLKANQSASDASQRIQDHAFKITSTYWELFVARAQLEQIDRGLRSLLQLRDQLAGRADIDGLRSQLLRADATISRQHAARSQALAQAVTAEARLRATVAAPELLQSRDRPLLPATPSMDWRSRIEIKTELGNALSFRPEIQVLKTGLKAARVRLQVAEHELRPTLNLVLEGYLRGLNGEFDAAQSFGDQFSEGAPSYTAGLTYSRPYRNLAARAILRERRLEMRRTLLELDNALLTIGAEVEGAAARLDAAYQQLEAAVQATLTTLQEIEYLEARLQNAFLDSNSTSIVLDQLLDAQLKLIQSENAWAQAQGDHMLAIANLRLTTGSLLPNLASQLW